MLSRYGEDGFTGNNIAGFLISADMLALHSSDSGDVAVLRCGHTKIVLGNYQITSFHPHEIRLEKMVSVTNSLPRFQVQCHPRPFANALLAI